MVYMNRKISETLKIYDLYVDENWKGLYDKLSSILDEAKEINCDFSIIKDIVPHVGVVSEILNDDSLVYKMFKYIERDVDFREEVSNEVYLMNIFERTIGLNLLTVEDRIAVLEKIYNTTWNTNKACALRMLCKIYILKEDYEELSRVLRDVAIHIYSEINKGCGDEVLIMKLEGILKQFGTISKENDPYGFEDIMEALLLSYTSVYYKVI